MCNIIPFWVSKGHILISITNQKLIKSYIILITLHFFLQSLIQQLFGLLVSGCRFSSWPEKVKVFLIFTACQRSCFYIINSFIWLFCHILSLTSYFITSSALCYFCTTRVLSFIFRFSRYPDSTSIKVKVTVKSLIP